ncbi:MAG TPA: aspartyl/glutamyl-tRNA amidotransferase subunit C [Hydrogenispora sp.]|nr:aspartyl/glutamyl-tRNA amidotransferase subunit C [Hydrogenispora sp.]
MVLTEEKVRALAAIARLGITEEELTALTIALNRTCQYIAEIREAPVPEGITEAFGGEPTNTGREDQVLPSWPREAVLRNAPEQANLCFQTPRILED